MWLKVIILLISFRMLNLSEIKMYSNVTFRLYDNNYRNT